MKMNVKTTDEQDEENLWDTIKSSNRKKLKL